MRKSQAHELNYWPSFSDLLIAVILMLILYLFIQEVNFYLSEAYLQQKMKDRQKEFRHTIRNALGPDSVAISNIEEIGVNQTISFQSSFLFDDGKWTFRDKKSRELIEKIVPVLISAIDSNDVQQIVVEGHTNSKPYKGKYGNWELASNRAVTVIKLLLEMGIESQTGTDHNSPSRLLSISGFADRDFVPTKEQTEDMEESKRIQFSLVYTLK